MLAIEVGPVDVARTRYAISPLGEAMQALREIGRASCRERV
jgi:hypothetical protein